MPWVSSARNSPNIELQLVSLWSAVEGLISEPPEDSSRISHFIQQMLPCICYRHIHKRSIYLYDKLLASYGNRFRTIIFKEPDYNNLHHHYRFTAVMIIEKNKNLRNELLDLTTNNPLALNRLHQFNKDYSKLDNLEKAMASHAQRVEWQLSRIYRVRNSIVHKGEKPSYAESLVLNMFEYYTSMLSAIVRKASKNKSKSDIDQVISSLHLESLANIEIIKSHKSEGSISKKLFEAIYL